MLFNSLEFLRFFGGEALLNFSPEGKDLMRAEKTP
jgi:hypothetical protein